MLWTKRQTHSSFYLLFHSDKLFFIFSCILYICVYLRNKFYDLCMVFGNKNYELYVVMNIAFK